MRNYQQNSHMKCFYFSTFTDSSSPNYHQATAITSPCLANMILHAKLQTKHLDVKYFRPIRDKTNTSSSCIPTLKLSTNSVCTRYMIPKIQLFSSRLCSFRATHFSVYTLHDSQNTAVFLDYVASGLG